jgi:hypothetical protein
MHKLSIRLMAALLTFLLGLAATTAWFINRSHKQEELRVLMPQERWVKIFFEMDELASKSINRMTKEAGLPSLQTSLLPGNDLEVRVWRGFGVDGETHAVVLKRSANQWSVLHLYERDKSQPVQKFQDVNAVPTSGWEKAWERLASAGISQLPDASEVQCGEGGLDGMAFIVEINTDQTYRTYKYSNPQYAKCSEAKQMIKIDEIIDEEFGWIH